MHCVKNQCILSQWKDCLWPKETSKVWIYVVMRLHWASIRTACGVQLNLYLKRKKGLLCNTFALVSVLLCLLSRQLSLLSTTFIVYPSQHHCLCSPIQKDSWAHYHVLGFMYVNYCFRLLHKMIYGMCIEQIAWKIQCTRLALLWRILLYNQHVLCINGLRSGL